MGKVLVTVKQGKVSGLIGNVCGFCEVFDSYYRLHATILFEKMWEQKGGRSRLIEVVVE